MCHWNCFECRTLYTQNVERSCICWRCLVASKMVNIFNLCNHTRSAVWTVWVLKRYYKSRKKTDPHIFWWICFFFCIQFANFFLINSWWRRRLIGLTKSWTTEGKSYSMLNLPEIVRHICEALCHTKLTQNRTHLYVKQHFTLNSPETGHTHMWSIVPHWTHQKQDTLIYEALFHTELTKKQDTLMWSIVSQWTHQKTRHTHVWSSVPHWTHQKQDKNKSEELWVTELARSIWHRCKWRVMAHSTCQKQEQHRSEELWHSELS